MATKNIFNQEDEEELGQKTTNLASGVIGGSTPTTSPGSTAKGTGWTNLQQYLDTNKGAGGAMVDAQLKGVNEEIGSTKESINQWADTAQKRAQDSMRKDEWSSKIAGKSADEISNTFRDPSQAQAFDAWKKLQDYWGASDATADEGYKNVFDASGKVDGKIKSANTWEGQNQLSKDAFGKQAADKGSRYTGGMGMLDTFVARGDAGNKYDSFQKNNEGFGNNLKDASSKVNTSIAAAKTQGGANYKTVMDTIADRIQGIQGEQDARAKAINDASRSEGLRVQEGLRGGYNKEFTFPDDISVDTYVRKVGGSDVANQAEIDALNALGGLDDDVSTGGYSKGSGEGGFDWQTYQDEVGKRFADWSKDRPLADTRIKKGDLIDQMIPGAYENQSSKVQSNDNGIIFTPTGPIYRPDGTLMNPDEVEAERKRAASNGGTSRNNKLN